MNMAPSRGELDSNLDRLYQNRFHAHNVERRRAAWKVIFRELFSRYIEPRSRVLEVAPGYCEFINNARCAERVGVDINPDAQQYAEEGVVIHTAPAEQMDEVLPSAHFDVAFMSNFLEHCRSRDNMLAVLACVERVLKPGGRVIILGPNFRYTYKEYYDFFDHHLALTDKAIAEALQLAGLELETMHPRTLPFSFQGRLPSWPWLIRLYLRMPIFWRLFGKQFLAVARRPPQSINAKRRAA